MQLILRRRSSQSPVLLEPSARLKKISVRVWIQWI